VHLCPVEPFGLAILEAMAAKVPVLLPDQGGAASLVPLLEPGSDGLSGLHFQANNARDLARRLRHLQAAGAEQLNLMADNAHRRLWACYSGRVRLNDYRELFKKVMAS